jgi:amidase
LGTQSGYDARVPSSLDDDPKLKALTPHNVHERLRGYSLRGKKIAWLGDWDGYLPMETGVIELCENALETFGELGMAVEEIKPPYDPQRFWEEIWLPFRHYGIILRKPHYDDPARRQLLKPEAIYEYEGSLRYSAHDLYNAAVKRSDWYKALLPVFEEYEYLAVPTAQVFPFDKHVHWPAKIAGRKMDTYHRWMEVVTHWTMSGNPVAAIPAGFNAQGLPMGIQLIGRPRRDYDLLRAAYAYEQATDYGQKRPTLVGG